MTAARIKRAGNFTLQRIVNLTTMKPGQTFFGRSRPSLFRDSFRD